MNSKRPTGHSPEREIPTFYKCACAHCGVVFEYSAQQAGKVVECPNCKEKSQLPEVEKLLLVEVQGPPVPTVKNCPTCGVELKFSDTKCANCENRRRQRINRLLILAVVSLALVCIAVWLGIRHNQATATTEEASKPEESILPQPIVNTPKSVSDLVPGRFTLEQKRGSDLMMAVGDIVNKSQNVHYRLKVDVDLLDATGTKIGTVSDYSAELGGNQNWHIVIRVNDPKAVNVKFAGIKEDQ